MPVAWSSQEKRVPMDALVFSLGRAKSKPMKAHKYYN
jgi:hypothetical protein